jgi:hypothetical protein
LRLSVSKTFVDTKEALALSKNNEQVIPLRKKPSKTTGNGLVEYILPIAVVGIMGGLLLWSSGFGDNFQG